MRGARPSSPGRSRTVRRLVVPAVAALALGGCDPVGINRACTEELRFGLTVIVVDAASGGPITDGRGVVRVRDGAWTDSIAFDGPRPATVAPLAPERPGRYDVEARFDGYLPWAETGVRVRQGECHVHSEVRTAPLRRGAGGQQGARPRDG